MARQRSSFMVRKENSNQTTVRNPNSKNPIGRKGVSHAVSYRVGKPFPKPATKPVKFKSYAGKRNTKGLRKKLSPIDSTKRQRWNAFYSNGRALKRNRYRIFRKSCTLFCEVTFVNSELHSFWTKSCNTVKEPHAEIKALEEIRNLEKTRAGIWKVDMLLSYSPCANCAGAIIKFKRQSTVSVQISLAFTAIYQHNEKAHRQGLRHLDSEPGIMLRVFTENDWVRLARETNVDYHRNRSRNQQDAFWYHRLQDILKRDVVLNMDFEDSSTVPQPVLTSRSSRKLECFMGTILILVVVLVITAVVSSLK